MLHGMDTRYIATPKDTVEALLEAGNRLKGGGVPLRRTFVQQGSRDAPQPGPLASLVHNGDQRGLDTFLLLKAVASVSPFDSHRSAAVWARALRHTGVSANEQTVSRIWRRLEGLRLVARSKTGRVANITLLKPPLVLPAEKAPEWYGISADTAPAWSRVVDETRCSKGDQNPQAGSPSAQGVHLRLPLHPPRRLPLGVGWQR